MGWNADWIKELMKNRGPAEHNRSRTMEEARYMIEHGTPDPRKKVKR